MKRVVSLIASSTEIVCALGLRSSLVGRSHECDFPASVRELPVCSQVKFIADGSSYTIDQRLKAILQEGLSVYRVSAEKLRELRPDVILTQMQCEVCAVSEKDVLEAMKETLGFEPRVVSLGAGDLDGIWKDIERVAVALDVPQDGRALVARLQERVKRVHDLCQATSDRPSVACVEWIDPLMAAGNWTPELVELAAGRNLFGRAGAHSPWLSWDELVRQDPDVIFVSPCGFDLPRTREEMPSLRARPGWANLKAVRSRRVYLADGNQYFNRPGPRIVESLEILGEMLHPGQVSFGHQGVGWHPDLI